MRLLSWSNSQRCRKRKLASVAIAAVVFCGAGLASTNSAEAAKPHHSRHGHAHRYHGHSGVRVYVHRPQHRHWHDTSHYDWHDTSHWDWHGDHWHFHRDGHWDFHRDGHWDYYGGRRHGRTVTSTGGDRSTFVSSNSFGFEAGRASPILIG